MVGLLSNPLTYSSGVNARSAPGVIYTCLYNYNNAHRLCLKQLVDLEVFRSFSGYFKPLLGPDGGFTSETVAETAMAINL